MGAFTNISLYFCNILGLLIKIGEVDKNKHNVEGVYLVL